MIGLLRTRPLSLPNPIIPLRQPFPSHTSVPAVKFQEQQFNNSSNQQFPYLPRPFGFVMVFVHPFGQRQPPRNKNIRTNANPKSKAPGSKNFIDVRGSFTSIPFHSASGSASLRPSYILFHLRSFHPLPLYTKVLPPVTLLPYLKFVRYFCASPMPLPPNPQNKKPRQNPRRSSCPHVPDHHPKVITQILAVLTL
jgi:hypothetical protein